MKMKFTFVVAAAVFAFAAASVNAQSIVMSGSSGIYLELGQSSAVQPLTGAAIANCGWSDKSKTFTLTDSRPTELTGETDAALTDSTNNAWVTWTINGGTCATTTAAELINVNLMVSVDSSVGNRCFFANPSCTVTTAAVGGPSTVNPSCTVGGGAINSASFTETSCIPVAVVNAINTPLSINTSATDIRPEDSLFATLRGFTTCGTSIGGSQYYGIGYQTEPSGYGTKAKGLVGTKIANGGENGAGGSALNLAAWTLSGNDPFAAAQGLTKNAPAFTVQAVGAVPVVVFVNPSLEAGFGSLQVTNVDRAILSGYLDGSLQRWQDIVPQGWVSTSTNGATEAAAESFTFVREFLSGTYNTTEFNVPNNVENQSSQDVGLASVDGNGLNPPLECAMIGGTTSAVGGALADQSGIVSSTYYRVRTIGTGSMVAAVEGKGNSLGYAFWSAANFSSTNAANAKYLTVDGVDPIQEVWQDGLVPTSGNGTLGNVTLSHVKDGSYPIWSILRIVCGSNCTATSALIKSATNFVGPNQPDFVPASTLQILRSHFAPPTVSFPASAPVTGGCTTATAANTPSNGNFAAGDSCENGGDVGGMVYSLQADGDFQNDTGNGYGEVGHRN